jgi:hypothetical protein
MNDHEEESHPSFGMIQINRIQSNPSISLFGSSIQHNEVIALRIEHAKVSRNLNRNWYYGTDQVVEIYMSYSQFTRAIMSLNTTGVPVTINRINSKPVEQKKGVINTKELFQKEIQHDIDKVLNNSRQACKVATELLKSNKQLNKEQKKELEGLIFKINQDLESNINFIGKSFDEQMDKTITEAHGEIEAFFDAKIQSLGIEALKQEVLKLPATDYEYIAESEEDE